MKRLAIVAALFVALCTSTAALAHGGHSITEKVLGAASVTEPYTIDVNAPADVVVAKAIVPAGASFGWHSHKSAAIVVVQSGALTLYDSADPACSPRHYGAGQGFVEQPDHVHLARNESRRPAVVYVSYVGLAHGVNPDVPATRPSHCHV